ncbi:H3 histone acetyltransferase [Martiniozyma asiatica (nom. inval.)]|nr:H3 histone acetyltransferase [Martiniozyma asiatica]
MFCCYSHGKFFVIQFDGSRPVWALEGRVKSGWTYIEKADSTGLSKRAVGPSLQKFIQTLIKIDPQHLLTKETTPKRKKIHVPGAYLSTTEYKLRIIQEFHRNPLVENHHADYDNKASVHSNGTHLTNGMNLVLFTRPEKEYLFPSSSKNKDKHLIGGSQLLKWWIRIIDCTNAKAKFIDIPGESKQVISHFKTDALWSIGHLYPSDLPATRVIPLLPDDPKGRFLEHLVVQGRTKISVNQFWNELQAQQEFRLGEVVGLLGAKFDVGIETPPEEWKMFRRKEYELVKEYLLNKEYNLEAEAEWSKLKSELETLGLKEWIVDETNETEASSKETTQKTTVNMLQPKRKTKNPLPNILQPRKKVKVNDNQA